MSAFLIPNLANIPAELRALPRWVMWRGESEPGTKPRKVPYRADLPNSRASTTDPDTWCSFSQAETAYAEGDWTGVGLVLNDDGIVGVDIDGCRNAETEVINSQATALLKHLGAGYVEVSPSGTGLRAFGYGPVLAIGCAGTYDGLNVELYSKGRYLTLTGVTIKAGPIVPLVGFGELAEAIRAGRVSGREAGSAERAAGSLPGHDFAVAGPSEYASPQTVSELRSALNVLDADDYHVWIANGNRLAGLGSTGRGLWMDWGRQSPRFDPAQAAAKWRGFAPSSTGYAAVFSAAQLEGWVNPASNAAQLAPRHGQMQASNELPLRGPSFEEVDLRGVHDVKPQEWWWHRYLPAGEVTLLAAHGGTGKSTLALQLAACLALGSPFLGKTTRSARVLFLSAEDPAQVVMRRLCQIIAAMDVDVEVLRANLRVIDATDGNPALFSEPAGGKRGAGATTAVYAHLKSYIEANEIDVVIADNASDLFDGDEINRAMVRTFIRSLRQLVRTTGGAVLLLSHVDKNTSKGNRGGPNTEGYSGSTAWHNSVRSRLFMHETEPGVLKLEHQKSNLGRKNGEIKLAWPDGGLPELIVDSGGGDGLADGLQAGADTRAILMLIHEFTGRGEFVATTKTSPSNVHRLLSGDRGYPKKVGPERAVLLIRDAERCGLVERIDYMSVDSKPRSRWGVTAAGREWAGIPPSPPSPPTIDDGGDCAGGGLAPPTPPTAGRGCGGLAAAEGRGGKRRRKAPDSAGAAA